MSNPSMVGFISLMVGAIIFFGLFSIIDSMVGKVISFVVFCLVLPFIFYSSADEKQHKEKKRIRKRNTRIKLILDLNEQTLNEFESLAVSLSKTEHFLDQAEKDFDEGAYSPFWDSIEKAANQLGYFDASIDKINDNLNKYCRHVELYETWVGEYEEGLPKFSVAVHDIKSTVVSIGTVKRLNGIVRKAQRDFQFASIYEQRKANQLLCYGFKNLAEALNDMTYEIAASIKSLDEKVKHISSTLSASLEVSIEMAERMEIAVEMLNNIQRRRYSGLAP